MIDTDVVRWERDYLAIPEYVAEARKSVAAYAGEIGAPDELVADIMLAVSEAATNTVVHAFVDRDPGMLRVVAEPGTDVLVISVIDDGSGLKPRSDSPGLGLGLPTIGQLVESFDIRDGHGGRGTEVRMVFTLPGMRAPAPPAASEDWRFEVLAEVARVAASGWPGPGVERLVEVLVPRVADACAIDLVESGQVHRVAARVDGDEELSRWLAARRPPPEAMESIMASMRGGDMRVTEVDEASNAQLAEGPSDVERMTATELQWWVNVPLVDGTVLLGTLGLGLRPGRPGPESQAPFLSAIGERAARGLANTQLMDELRRTRRRLEEILALLAESVTVHDERGHFVYANAAALRLLGVGSLDEFLAASPGDLASRFDIARPDGSEVPLEDLPGMRVAAGLPAEPLLSRSTERATGRVRWLVTRATRLAGDETLIVNVIEELSSLDEARRRLQTPGP